MKSEVKAMMSSSSVISLQNPNTQLGSLDSACIEKLLLHCASALEGNDVTLAQQVMWVLNNVASSLGDPNQRLASWFLRALVSRASRVCPAATPLATTGAALTPTRLMSVTELAGYVDLIPWHRFGYCASNSAIFDAVRGCPRLHVLDFSITHCMQWPTLIDALAKRPQGPPISLRITVPSFRPQVPPLLNVSCEEVGLRLANFSKLRQVPFEFNVLALGNYNTSSSLDHHGGEECFDLESLLRHLNPTSLNLRDDEALVVNLQNWLRYLPDYHEEPTTIKDYSLRDSFLKVIKGLNPRIVVVVDEDSELNSPSLTSRIGACFNYLWIPFDALETFLPKDSRQRIEYESDIGQRIENIIGFEGIQRIERLESGAASSQRMRNAGFTSVPFGEETIKEVKGLLDEHACGWGMKRQEEMLVLTWKGHNSVFATAWVPS